MKIGWRMSLLAMLTIVALGLVALSWRRGADRPPNVLMIVVDTLRADRIGAYGYPPGVTPFLDQLAARGVVFLNAYSTSSWTIPSVTSLFTSRYPSQHRVIAFGTIMGDQEVTFAERLASVGYVSGGFSANFTLKPHFGYARGFQQWVDEKTVQGSELRSDSLRWLDSVSQPPSSKPILLYLQFMEPHSPYDSDEPFRSRFARDDKGNPIDLKSEYNRLGRFDPIAGGGPCYTTDDFHLYVRAYDAAVATLDDEIRQLFDALRQRRFLDHAIVILTADHGEEFGEHGRALHGHTLYNESVHIPLIVTGPGLPAGLRVRENVSLIDIAPTLLDLVGLPTEPRFEGRSLRPLMEAEPAASNGAARAAFGSRDLILELPPQPVRAHEAGIVRGPTKVLRKIDGTHETYDLRVDPREVDGNATAADQSAAALLDVLQSETARLKQDASTPAAKEVLDETTRDRLRALGYQF